MSGTHFSLQFKMEAMNGKHFPLQLKMEAPPSARENAWRRHYHLPTKNHRYEQVHSVFPSYVML